MGQRLGDLFLGHSRVIGIQGDAARPQALAGGVEVAGRLLDLVVDPLWVDFVGMSEAEVLALHVAARVAAQGVAPQDVADGGHQGPFALAVEAPGQLVHVLHPDQADLPAPAGPVEGAHLRGRRLAERLSRHQAAVRGARRLGGLEAVRRRRLDLEGEEVVVVEVGHPVTGEGGGHGPAARPGQFDDHVVNAAVGTARRQQVADRGAMGLRHMVEERPTDQRVRRRSAEHRRGAGREDDGMGVVELDQHVSAAECKRHETVALALVVRSRGRLVHARPSRPAQPAGGRPAFALYALNMPPSMTENNTNRMVGAGVEDLLNVRRQIAARAARSRSAARGTTIVEPLWFN